MAGTEVSIDHLTHRFFDCIFLSQSNSLFLSLINAGDKAASEPLPLNDILEVKAGCVGFDHAELPSSSSKKGKTSKVKSENLHSSLFLTIRATPTPLASSRSYYLRLKSRSTRNDLLIGLRGILADLQVHEGVSISQIQTPAAAQQQAAAQQAAAQQAAAQQQQPQPNSTMSMGP